jgi:cell division protein FtsN
MPRDYKYRATSRGKRAPVSPWLTLLAGLLIGLFVAFLVYIKMQYPPGGQGSLVTPGKDTRDPARSDSRVERKPVRDTQPPPPRPRFDFYTLLPEMEVIIPEQEITGKSEAGLKQVEEPGTYLLQVASFRNFEQADRLKAKLTLSGFETDTQEVTVNGKDTYYRVRVGPYSSLGSLNEARSKLKTLGHDSILIRITG